MSLSLEEKKKRIRQFLTTIAPTDSVESLTTDTGFRERVESAKVSYEERDLALEAVEAVQKTDDLSPEQLFALEAIVLPRERPVVDIRNDAFQRPEEPFSHLYDRTEIRDAINRTIRSIGRIELPGNSRIPYGGTGFLVGPGLLMTNRHVAELFASGLGRQGLVFREGQKAAIDFKREILDRDRDVRTFQIRKILMIHPYWDMALLRVDGLDDGRKPLTLSTTPFEDLTGREIAVIGYPALDPRNDIELQNRIFRSTYYVKRMQPGKLMGRDSTVSFGKSVRALTHDSSTLGGNSGSAVIDVQTGLVLGLHFAGEYLKANYAVPAYELGRDSRVVDSGVTFERSIVSRSVPWDSYWANVESATGDRTKAARSAHVSTPADNSITVRSNGADAHAQSPSPSGVTTMRVTVPLEITITVGAPIPLTVSSGGVSQTSETRASQVSEGIERMAEPFREMDYSNRAGYDENFLGIHLPLPAVTDRDVVAKLEDGSHVLPYEHFSIVMHKQRRLALFTASNVDADRQRKQPEPGHDYSRKGLSGLGKNDMEKWFTDPRIPELYQLPDKFFTRDRGSFDKGHIIRREDVAWGDSYEELRRANGDTYHTTNCSPQVADFNQSSKRGEWGQLENFVLDQADDEKLSLFAGPVLDERDPEFHGVDDEGRVRIRIPRRFWKVVVARRGGELQSFAFMLEQDLSDTSMTESLEFAVTAEWREKMISIAELEDVIGNIQFPEVVRNGDQSGTPQGESVRAAAQRGDTRRGTAYTMRSSAGVDY